jgi:alkylation response protein AidB-like acyl-CoA dehydrogenase
MTEHAIIKGGSFLVDSVPPSDVFTPEDFREEHRMLINTTDRFVKNEVQPCIAAIEKEDFEVTRQLMRQAGALGLLGPEVEEEYGGSGLDSIASIIITERVGGTGSFGATLSVHSGIGTLPLVFFGSKEQKKRYLPALVSGETIGAYALTEPKAGTDAMSIETEATLSADGRHYILDGAKQFITNGGISDTFFTYAKVGGDKMTAFIVERGFEGVSTGIEEKKLGIRGTSTVSMYLDNARVPVENVVYQIGKGHHVAFNVLNIGRFKVAAGCVGMAKQAMEDSVRYSRERIQFDKPICQFGLIKRKISEMATKTYIAESMLYRTAGFIDGSLSSVNRGEDDVGEQIANNISEYAIECSINKIYCSEILAYVTDEAVQMHGGYGFCEDYPAERLYRDCRIFRIYEGTNEINRIIIAQWLMRKALRGELPFLSTEPSADGSGNGPLAYQSTSVYRAKKIFLLVFREAAQRYGISIGEEQQVMGLLSDMAVEIYALESGLLRALKSIKSIGKKDSGTKIDMVQLYTNDAMFRINDYARQLLAAMYTGEALDAQLATLSNLSQFCPEHCVQLRENIADRIIEAGGYAC